MGRPPSTMRAAGFATLAAVAFAISPVTSTTAVSLPSADSAAADCLTPSQNPDAAAKGGRAPGHEPMTQADAARVEAQSKELLAKKRAQGIVVPQGALAAATVPVYVHVMAGKNGHGDVTDKQITDQIAVLNTTFSGGESTQAANTGFTFTLAGVA